MDLPTAQYLQRLADGDPDLAAGVAAMADGDVVDAAARLAAVVDGSDDPVVRVRAAACHRLATHLRWNAFPGGMGASATEIFLRWTGEPSAVDVREDWAAMAREAGAAVDAEARVVGGVLCALRSVRVIVDYAAARLEPAEVDAQLEDALGTVAPLRDADDPGYAELASADLAHRARRPDRAVRFLQEAAAAFGAAGDQGGLGACHLLRGDWRAAPASNPESRNLTLVASASESSALDWALEGTEASVTGLDADGAAAACADAEEAFTAVGDDRGLAAVELRRSHLAAAGGDPDVAAGLAARSAQRSEAVGDRWGGWLARTHEALADIGAGRLTAGLATAEQVGAWGAGTGSFSYALGLGLLCSRSGRDWLLRRADPERALAAHRLARTLFAGLGAVTDEAQCLVDRGRVLQVVGDLDGAGAAFEEALDLLTSDIEARPAAAGDNRLRAITLAQTLYLLHLTRRDPSGMARGAELLRAQAARLPSDAGEDTVEGMLVAAAEATLTQVAVLVPLYRGEEAREAGDEAGAEAGYAAALEAVRSGDTPDADFLEAVVLGHWRRYEEASAALQRHLDAQAPPTGLVGRVLSRFGPLKAEIEVQQRRLHEQAGAFFRRLRDYPAAVRHFEALEREGDRWWERLERPWELLTDYGAACEGLGQLSRARALHEQAVAQLEERRARLRRDELRTALADTSGSAAVYLAAARTALALSAEAASSDDAAAADGWARQAFDDAERGRARGLLDLLSPGVGLARAAPGTGEAVRRWHQANAELSMRQGLLTVEQASAHPDPDRLAALREETAAARQELLDREADLERDAPDFAATVAVPAETLGVDEVAAALSPGVLLLAYHHLDEDLLAWAVTADGLARTHRTNIETVELDLAIRGFTEACWADEDWRRRGAGVAGLFLEPFADLVDGADRLVVVPPGAASAMPFHVLPWHDGPLLASAAVSYLPSASSLRYLARRGGEPGDRVLAVGDPARMRWQPLPGEEPGPAEPLPAAATEARFVAALFDRARLLVGEEATEAAVRAGIGDHPIVHLATHGELSEQAPLLSCVLLADGEALSVYELMGIALDADLVVLSACDTGRGRTTAGGDVLGLTRGLLGAGARGAVVTLWPARDRATCLVMAGFYRRLRGGAHPAVALQAAQTHVRGLDDAGRRAEFAALEAALDDPAGSALLTPLSATAPPGGPGADAPPDHWAPFLYVGA